MSALARLRADVLLVTAAIVLVAWIPVTLAETSPCLSTLGQRDIEHCSLQYTWQELSSAYQQRLLDFRAGGLGRCASDHLQVWLCIRPHPCSDDNVDRFCFVYNESSSIFLPIGKDKDLGYCAQESPYQPHPQLACCDSAATLSVLEARIQSVNTSLISVKGQFSPEAFDELKASIVSEVDARLQNPGYLWRVGSFGTCNNNCGPGIQVREVFCASASGPLAGPELCPQADKPPSVQTCTDYSACTYAWLTGTFGTCSTVCGVGMRHRTVTCMRQSSTASSVVNSSYCGTKDDAPLSTEPCTQLSGCTYGWYAGAWNACSNRCGDGRRTRTVSCMRSDNVAVESSLCIAGTEPEVSQVCSDASGCVYQYMDECATGTHTCSSAAICTDTFGSFECVCKAGFQGPGTHCIDIDECTKTPGMQSPCTSAYSTCVNTYGSFLCVCQRGSYLVEDGSCVSCPAGTTTQVSGASSLSSCSACAQGHYGNVASGCTPCPEGSWSEAGTLERSACKCKLGYVGYITNNDGNCTLSDTDPGSLLLVAEPGRSCAQFCSTIGRSCKQNLAKASYAHEEIREAIARSTLLVKETTFFTLNMANDWTQAVGMCESVGANAAIVLNSEENAVARSVCQNERCLIGIMSWGYPQAKWTTWEVFNGWHSLYNDQEWSYGCAATYNDVWSFSWCNSRMVPLCKRVNLELPQDCSGGFRTSRQLYAPYISESNTCYSADIQVNTSCLALPNAGHSRLCVCSAPCSENYYQVGSACKRCPDYARSQSGSTSIFDCQCSEGYLLANSSSPNGGDGVCVSCPAFSISIPGASSIADCLCLAGMYLSETLECNTCPSGSTSPLGSIGIQSCMCPAGTYGTPATTGCKPCPHISNSAAGSTLVTECFCPRYFGVVRLGYSRFIADENDVCEADTARWILGSDGQSCNAACQTVGRICQQVDTSVFSTTLLQQLTLPRNLDFTCVEIFTDFQDLGKPYPSVTASGSTCYLLSNSLKETADCTRESPDLKPICSCACPANFYGSGGYQCTACPPNSTAPAGSRYALDCICRPGYIASGSSCVPCGNGLMVPFLEINDVFSSSYNLRGWQGAGMTTTCGKYGTMLGGAGVLGDQSSLSKTYTNLCQHNTVLLEFKIVAIDGWEGENITLFIDNVEVWSTTVLATTGVDVCGSVPSSFDTNEGREAVVTGKVTVPHSERTLNLKFQTTLSRELRMVNIWDETRAYKSSRYWGLSSFSIFMPCSSNQQSACTSPLSRAWLNNADIERGLATCKRKASSVFNIYARYTAASFGKTKENQWDDVSGREMHSVEYRGSFQRVNTSSSMREVTAIHGDVNAGIRFPERSIPSEFTICTMSKFGSSQRYRIFDSVYNYWWLHGHASVAGVVMYGDYWSIPAESPVTDWLVMCGQNSGGSIKLANGIQVQVEQSGGQGDQQLSINFGISEQYSEWYVAQIAIWDRALSLQELQIVTANFMNGDWDSIDPSQQDC